LKGLTGIRVSFDASGNPWRGIKKGGFIFQEEK